MATIGERLLNTDVRVLPILLTPQIQRQLVMSDLDTIKALIAQDPRPAYRRTETDTSFVMRYKSVDISFQLLESGELQITNIVAV